MVILSPRIFGKWISVFMGKIAFLCLVSLLGMQPSGLWAKDLPVTVKAVAAAMADMGYTDVGVSLRVFGGYVLQGKMDDTFVMIALSENGTRLDRVEIFVDQDSNGVFGINESLGSDDQRFLMNAIVAAFPRELANGLPQEVGEQVALTNDLNVTVPGFTQEFEASVTGTSMRIMASEKLGVGVPTLIDVTNATSKDVEGEQVLGSKRKQVVEVAGLLSRSRDTNVSHSGGTKVGLTPSDAAGIRDNVLASTPDSNTLRDQIELHVPTADGIRAGIVSAP